MTKDDCKNINDKEEITRENFRDVGVNTDLNLTKDGCNKPETCSLLSFDLEGVKLDAVITESKLTNNIRSNRERINENTEIINQIELGRTSLLNAIESKLCTIEFKISTTAVAACENDEIITLQDDLLNERERYRRLELNMLEVVQIKNNEIQNLKSKIMSLKNSTEYVQLCEIKSNCVPPNSSIVPPDVVNLTECSQPCEITTNLQCPIVLTDSPIVAPDVVIPNERSQSGERITSNQRPGASQSNGTKYRKQYGKDRLHSNTNNSGSKVEMSQRSFRPRYTIPLLTGSNFNFIHERVKDDERVAEEPVQSSQFFGGLPVPYMDKCMNYHLTMKYPVKMK